MRNCEVTIPTTLEVLPLDELKAHLRLTHDREDSLLLSIAQAAVEVIEDDTLVSLGLKGYRTWLDRFPHANHEIQLPRSPCTDARVQYVDEAGATQELVKDLDYFVDNSTSPSRLCLCAGKSWPGTGDRKAAVTVNFWAGHISPEAIPAKAKAIVRIIAAYLYEHRDLLERIETGSMERVGEVYEAIKASLKNWQFS